MFSSGEQEGACKNKLINKKKNPSAVSQLNEGAFLRVSSQRIVKIIRNHPLRNIIMQRKLRGRLTSNVDTYLIE